MSTRTIDELSALLREDLGWRRKEIRVLQTIVAGSEASKKQAVLRGAVAALYAHWEGFTKTACRAYLEFIKIRRLRNSELSIPLLGLCLKRYLKRVAGSDRFDSHLEFSDWLLREWDRRAMLPQSDDIIRTGNLDAHVFRSYMLGLGLPYVVEFQLAEKPVIDALVHIRNHLAHGEWHTIDEAEYEQLLIWITRLMECVCKNIEDAAATSSFRRQLQQLS